MHCVLEARQCNKCGNCDRCDLDTDKKCDNCCLCLEEQSAELRTIVIQKDDIEADEESRKKRKTYRWKPH